MKTFAYAALIASAMAVRLMETEVTETPVEDAATMDDIADLTLGDLEGEQEGLGDCFLEKTGEALAERSMDEDEIRELGAELVEGAEAGKTLGDAVERLREKGEEHGVDTDGQDEFLADVLEKVKGCKKQRKEKREGKKDERQGDKPASDDDEALELAQEGEVEEESSAPDGEDLRALAGEAKAALEDMDSEEREVLADEVKGALEDMSVDEEDLEAVKEAVKEGAEDKLREAFEALPEEAQEKVREGVEALKAAKADMEGDDDGEGSDDGEGPEERKAPRGGKKE